MLTEEPVLRMERRELEALQLGSVQMLAPSLAKFGPLGVKEFEVFDIPYMFPTEAFLARVESGRANLSDRIKTIGARRVDRDPSIIADARINALRRREHQGCDQERGRAAQGDLPLGLT